MAWNLNKSITKIFFLVGFYIGISATLFGVLIGVLFSFYIENIRRFLSEIFNISSNSEISIKKTISYFEEILKKKIYIERDLKRVRSESSEVYRLLGSNKKFIKQTNWVPKYRNSKGFKLALKKTFDWYLSNFSKIQNVDKLFT